MNLIIKVDTMKRFTFLCAENQILDRRQLDSLVGGKMGNCGCACLGETDPSKGSGTFDNAYANDANGYVSPNVPQEDLIWTFP